MVKHFVVMNIMLYYTKERLQYSNLSAVNDIKEVIKDAVIDVKEDDPTDCMKDSSSINWCSDIITAINFSGRYLKSPQWLERTHASRWMEDMKAILKANDDDDEKESRTVSMTKFSKLCQYCCCLYDSSFDSKNSEELPDGGKVTLKLTVKAVRSYPSQRSDRYWVSSEHNLRSHIDMVTLGTTSNAQGNVSQVIS